MPSAAVYRRRRLAVGGGLLATLAAAVYLPMTLLAPLQPADLSPTPTPDEALPGVALDLPGYGAAAIGAVGYDGVLAAQESSSPLPLASITKVVTALVVLDAHPLAADEAGPTLTMGSTDVGYLGQVLADDGQAAPVTEGLQLSERQVLELALVHSANNYALSLSTWAFGSQEAFVQAAAAWLAAQGFTTIVVNEPTGLDPANVGSATELVRLGELALANPVIAQIVGTGSIDVPGVGSFDNTNALLGVDGVTGIKTGTLDEANLLFSASYDVEGEAVTLVGVILGAVNHRILDDDVVALLDTARVGFVRVPLVTAGESFGTLATDWGDTAQAVATEDASVVVWNAGVVTTRARIDPVLLGDDGDPVGSVTITVGPDTVTVPLELDGELDDPGPWWRLGHPGLAFGAP
ncbi:MAG: D-alanyl-D-alanine carboxypeptidase [Actinomycetales bacterium]|nr:D-alanyl-D-alanine carboxypeptidase [Actinomycetales bacterium]